MSVVAGATEIPPERLIGSREVSSARGVANFSATGFGVMQSGQGYRLRLASTGLPALESASFDVPPGQPVRLRFVSSPEQARRPSPHGAGAPRPALPCETGALPVSKCAPRALTPM